MNRKYLLTLVLFLVCTISYAQKERLIVHEFKKTPQVAYSDLSTVKNLIIGAFDATNRFEILDADQQKLVEKETTIREDKNSIYDINPNTGEIKTKANRYALEGEVTVCEVTKRRYEGGTTYSCVLVYTVSIIDLEENTTVVTETFKHTPPSAVGGVIGAVIPELGKAAGKISGEAETPEIAKNKVFKHIEKDIIKMVDKEFPITGTIFAEDFSVEKGKITRCYINIGEAHGVREGDKFTIMESMTKVGMVIVEEIGALKVEKIHKDITECKVTKGGKELMQAMERYMEYLDTDPEHAYPLKVVIKK